MDKASVLGDAIKYVKLLQERVKKLEEEGAKKAGESTTIVKKTRLLVDDDHDLSSSDQNSGVLSNEPLPEIEARVSGKDVLIKIHCEKHKGYLANILREIENLHLTILDTSVLQFGNSTIDTTIVAQVYIPCTSFFVINLFVLLYIVFKFYILSLLGGNKYRILRLCSVLAS